MKKENKIPLTKEEKQKELIRSIKFILFSISAGLIEAVSYIIMTNGIDNPVFTYESYKWVPLTISLALSVIWNFTLNRKFTFMSANNVPLAMLKTLGYYAVFGPLSIWLAQIYLIDQLHWHELGVKAIVMFVNFVTEFLFQRYIVFGKTIDTNNIAQKKKAKEKEEAN